MPPKYDTIALCLPPPLLLLLLLLRWLLLPLLVSFGNHILCTTPTDDVEAVHRKQSRIAEAEESESRLLQEWTDPISQEVMVEPVTTSGGHTYERASIEHWLANHDTDPLTNKGTQRHCMAHLVYCMAAVQPTCMMCLLYLLVLLMLPCAGVHYMYSNTYVLQCCKTSG